MPEVQLAIPSCHILEVTAQSHSPGWRAPQGSSRASGLLRTVAKQSTSTRPAQDRCTRERPRPAQDRASSSVKTSARMLSSKRMKPGRTAASLVVGHHKEEEQAKHRPAASCQRSLQSPPRTAGSRLGTGIARLRYQCEVATGLTQWTCYTSRFPSHQSSRTASGFSHLWQRWTSASAFTGQNRAQCLAWPKGTLRFTQVLCFHMEWTWQVGYMTCYMRIDTCFWMATCWNLKMTCLAFEGNLTSP